MHRALLLTGLLLWLAATVLLRLVGQFVLRSSAWPSILILFLLSFALMAWLARRLCARFRLPPERWPAGAVSLALPTLLLDPFSSAFFALFFPNIAPEMAGIFGGWMLICCAGALLGATLRPGAPS